MYRFIGMLGLWMLAMQGAAVAGGDLFDDLFGPYLDRRDTVTPGGGNAKDTNAAIHVIDPWPHRVGDRHIPGDGKRSVDAIIATARRSDAPAQSDAATAQSSSSTQAEPASGGGTTAAH